MKKPSMFFLLKTFSERAHLDGFLNGKLYMNTLEYFRRYENLSCGRGDDLDGAISIPKNNISRISFGPIAIKTSDLASDVKVGLHGHVFCMHAASLDLSRAYSEVELKQALQLPVENSALGGYLVWIKDIRSFIERANLAAKKLKLNLKRGHIRYSDPSSNNSIPSVDEIPFTKDVTFAHQQEYRFFLSGLVNQFGCEPYKLEIGDIHDIAEVVGSIDEFNQLMSNAQLLQNAEQAISLSIDPNQ